MVSKSILHICRIKKGERLCQRTKSEWTIPFRTLHLWNCDFDDGATVPPMRSVQCSEVNTDPTLGVQLGVHLWSSPGLSGSLFSLETS